MVRSLKANAAPAQGCRGVQGTRSSSQMLRRSWAMKRGGVARHFREVLTGLCTDFGFYSRLLGELVVGLGREESKHDLTLIWKRVQLSC